MAKASITPVMRFLLDDPAPVAEFRREDISPLLWVNGMMPTCEEWKTLATHDFKDYQLKVYGLVEKPGELQAPGKKEQITLHHCIQGWSGIAAWGRLPLADLIRTVRPLPSARAVLCHSVGEGVALHEVVEGVRYDDNLSMENALNPQTLLAYEMNYQLLTDLYGAPLRLRVKNQLGFKMVKWIEAIEFVENIQPVGKDEGGFAEDYE